MNYLKLFKIAFSVFFVFAIAVAYPQLQKSEAIETSAPVEQESAQATLSPQAMVETVYPYTVEPLVPDESLMPTPTPTPTTASQVVTAGLSDATVAKLEAALNQETDDTVYQTVEEYFGTTGGGVTGDAPFVTIPSSSAEVSMSGSVPVLTVTDASLTSYGQITAYNSFATEYKYYTYQVAQAYGVSYEMLMAIMYNESTFHVNATNYNTNGTTDRGLMQINDVCYSTVAAHLGLTSIDQLYDPYVSIQAGAYLIYYHMQSYPAEENALLCYQCGAAGAQYYFESGTRPVSYTRVITNRDIYISANLT